MADLQVAIDALELADTSPRKAVLVQMTNKISSLTIKQVNFKKQNSLLMAAESEVEMLLHPDQDKNLVPD